MPSNPAHCCSETRVCYVALPISTSIAIARCRHVTKCMRRKTQFVGADEILVATGDNLQERKRLLNEGADCIMVLPVSGSACDT